MNKIVSIFGDFIALYFLLISCESNSTLEISKTDSGNENSSITYKERSVKLIRYSAATSHKRSKPKLQVEAANREKFRKVIQVDEILMTYTCGVNRRGLPSSSSLDSVTPQKLYSLINSEFQDRISSYFNSHLCSDIETSTTLKSVDVSVSIIDQ